MSSDPRPFLRCTLAHALQATIQALFPHLHLVLALTLFLLLVLAWPSTVALAQQPPPEAPVTKTFWDEYGSTVMAALVGLLFSGILTWLLRPVFERLGTSLADRLGKLGSGWGFRRRYLNYLTEKHQVLDARGLRDLAKRPVELERVYVSLSLHALETPVIEGESHPMGVGEALAQHRRLVLLGGPGTGKSTLLAYLALTYARRLAKNRLGLKERLLPIYVPLFELKSVLEGENNMLHEYLDALYHSKNLAPRPGFFERALRRGRCIVLLDGLDEVADETERRAMSNWVDELVNVYPKNRYVVTSRPLSYQRTPLNSFVALTLRDFSDDDVRQFADHWCLAVELAMQRKINAGVRQRAREASRDLVAAIESNAKVRALAVNPLLLSIVALVHRYRAKLPRRRVDLYDECVQVLLGHWDEAKGLARTLSPRQKQAILQPLALALHRQERQVIGRLELVERIGALLPQVGGAKAATMAAAAEFVDEIIERSGLLVEVGLDRCGWSHITFQEYLCARALSEDPSERSLILEHLGEGWWQETTLLYVGMVDATPVVEALLHSKDDDDQRLLLAGRCVVEAVRLSPVVRKRTMQRLQAFLETCDGPQFLAVGQVLAEVAGEDGVDFFLRIAQRDQVRRETALWALGQMALQSNETLRERVVAQLGRYLGDGALHGLALKVLAASCPHDRLASMLDETMVTVPAGVFLMGEEKHQVHANGFAIDRYPVTNIQYARFVAATRRDAPGHWEKGVIPEGKALHPVVRVTWQDAVRYAEWVGKRLPTEKEWEKAARGTDGRAYPWGEVFDADKCNTTESVIGDTTMVSRYSPAGDSPYGCVDMAGNVWEWTQNEHESYRGTGVLRGGAFWDNASQVRSSARGHGGLGRAVDGFGFRCVSRTFPSDS